MQRNKRAVSKPHCVFCHGFCLFLQNICKWTKPLRLAEILHGFGYGVLHRAGHKQMQEVMDSTNIIFFPMFIGWKKSRWLHQEHTGCSLLQCCEEVLKKSLCAFNSHGIHFLAIQGIRSLKLEWRITDSFSPPCLISKGHQLTSNASQ